MISRKQKTSKLLNIVISSLIIGIPGCNKPEAIQTPIAGEIIIEEGEPLIELISRLPEKPIREGRVDYGGSGGAYFLGLEFADQSVLPVVVDPSHRVVGRLPDDPTWPNGYDVIVSSPVIVGK